MLEQKLNALLANYEVMLHKLQTYHWYIKGKTFFADHAQLETYYDQAFENIDLIAESLLMLGEKPLANLQDVLETASVEEAEAKAVTQDHVYKSICADFETQLRCALDVKREAEEEDNPLIGAMIDGIIAQLYKNTWMLRQAMA